MIRWNNDQYRLAQSVAAALTRMISKDQIKLQAVASILNVSEELATHMLVEEPPTISVVSMKACMRAFNLSALFILTEKGETHFQTETPSGRLLEALNSIILRGDFESIPEYFRVLGIDDEREYMKVCLGQMELDAMRIMNVSTRYLINPAYLYSPLKETPVFV